MAGDPRACYAGELNELLTDTFFRDGSMARTKKVALMFPVARMHEGQFVRGVIDYASERGTWTFDANPEMFAVSMRALAGWSGHGVIAQLRTEGQVRAARTLGVPVVNLAGTLRHTGLPRLMVDQEAVGRLAAEHLLERGFRRFAYYGQQNTWYSRERQRGFVDRIAAAGGECSLLEAPRSFGAGRPWHHWVELLQQWLKTLKPPVGLMAVHDYRARMALDACLQLQLRVPGDVAIVGVDNEPIACEFSEVPLSSIARNSRQEGYQAASLLDRLMTGKQPPKDDVLIPPEGVVARRSTDTEAIENPHVAAAVRFIREHVDEAFGIETLARHTSVSRRYLHYHFNRCLGCTPHRYVNRARVARAKQLLAQPEKLPLQEIARACGFSEPRRLRLVFERVTGVAPAEYRRSLSLRP